jgi:hypothetical protein
MCLTSSLVMGLCGSIASVNVDYFIIKRKLYSLTKTSDISTANPEIERTLMPYRVNIQAELFSVL